MIVIDVVTVDHLDHADRLVDARAVDVFAQQVVIAIVFGDHVVAVIQVSGAVAIDLLFAAPAIYIVFVVNRLPIRRILSRRRPRPLDIVHPAAIVT